MMVDVAVAVCSTISSHNSDETDLPSKCYVTIGAKSRYSYVKLCCSILLHFLNNYIAV